MYICICSVYVYMCYYFLIWGIFLFLIYKEIPAGFFSKNLKRKIFNIQI